MTLTEIRQTAFSKTMAPHLIACLDYTNLDEQASEADIQQLCETAEMQATPVAAVCVYSRFVALCKQTLTNKNIQIATVVNFPSGEQRLSEVRQEIEFSLASGATEIDLVFPYQNFLAGNRKASEIFLNECEKQIHPHATLKIILETGVLGQAPSIHDASLLALDQGADFLKTSTGKVPIGATLEAAEIMLSAIHSRNKEVGFKASGGVKTPKEAYEYYLLTKSLLQTEPCAKNFRIGASRLLDALLNL